MSLRAGIACGVIGWAALGASAASAQPVLANRHAHHRYHYYNRVDVDAPPVVPEGYAYGGYARGLPYECAPGYGPGYAPGPGYFIAPVLGLDAPGYGCNGY